ncbi:hypothetical protein ACH4XT_37140 [Streptomyces avidinii]|uniref:hypothetical protein n=1 Tax=Streptomyces avidinii TaxID=1895 RepID=UPI0037A09129|nr:hypothetical protein OG592_00635 [Streptomyces avidinii]WST49947.1 hypothetical protein OG592_40165 [Streptomyces avidinii]
MRNIARVAATAALVCAAVLTAGGAAQGDPIDWPVAPASADPIDWPVRPGPAAGPAVALIDWP